MASLRRVSGCLGAMVLLAACPGPDGGEPVAGSTAGPETGADPSEGSGATEGPGQTSTPDPTGEDDTSTGGDPPPPDGGLGPFGFGYVEHPEILATWVGFADFDGDGLVDLFVKGPRGGVVYAGDGQGGFTELSLEALAEPSDFMHAADFDGDGDVDVALFDGYSGDDIYLLINEGRGTFANTQTVALDGFHGFGTRPLDYDHDPAMDLFVPQGHSSGALIGVAQGDGTFVMDAPVVQPACYFSNTAVGDLDGDGFDDVVGTGSCNSVPEGLPLISYRRIDGAFAADQMIYAELGPTLEGCDVVMLDLDDDGDLDVVTATDLGLYVLTNVGGGQLQDPPLVLAHDYVGYTKQVIPLRVAPDDGPAFVLESYEDRRSGAAALVVLEPDGSALTTHPLELQGRVAGSADIDGDGRPDLAVLSVETGALSLWLSGS